ncbi:hypothetical protein ACHAWF_009392 [Thalassiosira exigua]
MSEKEQAQLPHKATFARLGRSVWFTLEHSRRARGVGDALEEGLSRVKEQNDQVASMGLSWIANGMFDDRRRWSDGQWVAFLRMWQVNAPLFSGEDATDEEKRLCNHLTIYYTFYANLPDEPRGDRPEGFDMTTAEKRLDEYLAQFEERLGDPLRECSK